MAGWCLEGRWETGAVDVSSSRAGRQSTSLVELGFSGAAGQQGHLRMGRWMLRGVTSSPWVPGSTSGVDPAAVPGVRMGRNRPSRKHLTHPGSG